MALRLLVKVELVPLETLLPHEQVEEHRVDNLETMTLRWRAHTKPLLVDGRTGTILDGPHRTKEAAVSYTQLTQQKKRRV